MRYRDKDPKPDGASAGTRLSKNEDAPKPGFYYEKDDQTWTWAGGAGKDQALVFYIFREPLGRLDMVLSGFSGRATRLLAKTLAVRGEEFWPPIYESGGLKVGAYIVQYEDEAVTIIAMPCCRRMNPLRPRSCLCLPKRSHAVWQGFR